MKSAPITKIFCLWLSSWCVQFTNNRRFAIFHHAPIIVIFTTDNYNHSINIIITDIIISITRGRRLRFAGHCWWRIKDELVSDLLLWLPKRGITSVGWPAYTCIDQLKDERVASWKKGCQLRSQIAKSGINKSEQSEQARLSPGW